MSILDTLKQYGQPRLAGQITSLAGEKQAKLIQQAESVDWEEVSGLVKSHVLQKPVTKIPADLAPAPFFPYPPKTEEQKAYYQKAQEKGSALLREGAVAALTVAGGQGTRLGFDGPKGTYPITPVLGKTLFQYFAEGILRTGEKYGHPLHWFIMTSRMNDKATRDFFETNRFFGLNPENVHFFTQGVMPVFGYDGQVLLESEDSMAFSPDGHGGTLLALKRSGALDFLKDNGIRYLSYFQVDNPLVSVANPLFIGLHALEGSEMSCIMLAKTGPKEKLGNFCMTGGRLSIIEYSDMPDELAEKRNPDGTLQYLAGSPAIHVISREFAEKLTSSGRLDLPRHRADKKVAFYDPETGNTVTPETPNAVKLEAFIFDALPLAEKTMILEGVRSECFAPTKNKTGVDSAESCRAMLCARDMRRLRLAGVTVADDAIVELSPRSVIDDEDAVRLFAGKSVPAVASGKKAAFGK